MAQRVASIADASRHVASKRQVPAGLRRIDVLVRRLRRELIHVPSEQQDAVRARVIAALRVVADEHVASCAPPPRRSGAALVATATSCSLMGLALAPVLPALGAALLVVALAGALAAAAVLGLRAGRRRFGRPRPAAPRWCS